MSSPESPPAGGFTWLRDGRRKLGDRFWRAARGRDPKPGVISDPTPRVELPEFSHDWGTELKELGLVPEPEPPAQDRGQEPGPEFEFESESESESGEQIDDRYNTRRINPEDFSPPTIEDPEFSDFSEDVYAELRERGIEPEPFRAYREHLKHFEPGPTLQERLDHYLERGIEEPKLEQPVTLQQQLDALNDRPGVAVRSVEVAGWRLQQLHDELNDHTGRHQGDFGVGPNIPAQPLAADIHRSDGNRRVRFAETKRVRAYDQDPSREPLTQDDYSSFGSNFPDDDDQSFDSNASTDTIYANDNSSTDTIYPYDNPPGTSEDDHSFDRNASDSNSANAPGGIQVRMTTSTEVTCQPNPYRTIYTGSNRSFGGYSNDARVGPLQQQLEAERQRGAEDERARDTTPDYGQDL